MSIISMTIEIIELPLIPYTGLANNTKSQLEGEDQYEQTKYYLFRCQEYGKSNYVKNLIPFT